MTGPEHFRKAEEALLRAEYLLGGTFDRPVTHEEVIMAAQFLGDGQVHAILAQTAATAAAAGLVEYRDGKPKQWDGRDHLV